MPHEDYVLGHIYPAHNRVSNYKWGSQVMANPTTTQPPRRRVTPLTRAVAAVLAAVLVAASGGCSRATESSREHYPEASFPRWAQQLKDPEPEKRTEALRTLSAFYARHADELVPQLIALLGDSDARVRLWAAHGIECVACEREAGTHMAEAAKPALLRTLPQLGRRVRAAAIESLRAIRQLSRPEVVAVAACLADPEKRVRHTAEAAIGYLALLGVDAKAAAPALEAALGDPDPNVRWRCSAPGPRRLEQGSRSRRLIRVLGQGRGTMGVSSLPSCWARWGLWQRAGRRPSARCSATRTRRRARQPGRFWRVSADPGAAVPILVECLASRRTTSPRAGQPPAVAEPDEDAAPGGRGPLRIAHFQHIVTEGCRGRP